MVISHEHRYLFIETPRTASVSISVELCNLYGGQSILNRHSNYFEFERIATEEEKKYFVFSTIRNPLDEIVSLYFKLKTDHRGAYTDPSRFLRKGGHVTRQMKKKYEFIYTNNADFETFFKRFYKFPYNSVLYLNRKHCDFIIRFENLQEDFLKVLELLNIPQKRTLPRTNITEERIKSYLDYYYPTCIDSSKKIFGPFLADWGYPYPENWGDYSVTKYEQWRYKFVSQLRVLYWRYFRWGRGKLAKVIRRLFLE